MSRNLKSILIHTGIALGLAITSFCLVFFLSKHFSLTGWCDALFVASAVDLAGGLFVLIRRSGSFDVLHYGVSRLIDQFRHKDEREYKTAGDYQLAMKEKRQRNAFPYWVYFAIGAALLVATLILLIVINSQY